MAVDHLPRRADNVVVGGGTAGAAVAAILASIRNSWLCCGAGWGRTRRRVDSLGRVHWIDNLYVADASIMPAIPVNTNVPALVIGERIAQWLLEQ
jgi:choline dehydrogenase-like flavoprotein